MGDRILRFPRALSATIYEQPVGGCPWNDKPSGLWAFTVRDGHGEYVATGGDCSTSWEAERLARAAVERELNRATQRDERRRAVAGGGR